MTAVAQGFVFRVLAAAEKQLAAFLGGILNGFEFAALMASVTKGLFCALAAGAPEVGLPSIHIDGERFLLGDDGLCHGLGSSLRW